MNPIASLELVLLAAALLLALGAWTQWRTSVPCARSVRAALVALRLSASLALAGVALDVGRWRQPTRGGDREWALLLDRSGSMNTADVGGRARIRAAAEMAVRARQKAPAGERLRVHGFDAALGEVLADAALADLRADGAATDLNRSLNELLDRYSAGSRLAGVTVLSDGRQTAGRESLDAARRALARGVSVTTVALGGPVARRDLEVAVRRRQLVAHVGQRLKIRGQVRNRNLGHIRPVVRLFGPDPAPVAERTLELTNDAVAEVAFEVAPAAAGLIEYRVEAPPWEGEALQANNAASVRVRVVEKPVRVLLIEGTPCWDTKFLAQLFRQQTNLVVTGIYRVSEDRCFRIEGAGARTEEAATDAFPSDPASLAAYDVVVFGKGVEYFLDAARLAALKTYLRERGGAVVIARGKPYHAAEFPEFAAIEPVDWGPLSSAGHRWEPTVDGEAAGLFGGLLPAAGDPIWSKLPVLRGAYPCRRVKSFATVLVEGVATGDSRQRFPAVASMRYGKGIVIAVNAEGLWQWDFFAAAETRAAYGEFWTELVQWAVTHADFVPGYHYAVRLGAATAAPGDTVPIRIARRGPDASPALTLRIAGASGPAMLAPAPADGRADRWEAVFSPESPGLYRVELVEAAGGAPLAPVETLEVPAPPGERDELGADPGYLKRLASESGGKLAEPADWDAVVAAMGSDAPVAIEGEAVWESLWDRAWVLLAVVGVFCVEWFLRRRSGLA
jgi:hypothetical protein